MSALLFERACVVLVGSQRFEGLRVQFKVEKTNAKEPNTAEVSITNLKKSSRAAMQSKGTRIVVLAGYRNSIAQIFAGDSRTIDHVRTGPDWTTKIQCGDGEVAYQHGRINESFAAGTPVSAVLKKVSSILQAKGLDPGNLVSAASGLTEQYVNGYSARGKASAELDRILTANGFEWSIQDGRLQVLRPAEVVKEQAVLLTPNTGLVGSPEHGTPEKKGKPSILKLKSLLQPTIRVGGRIQVDALETKGLFKVRKLTHSGDTAGGDWYTTVEALPT